MTCKQLAHQPDFGQSKYNLFIRHLQTAISDFLRRNDGAALKNQALINQKNLCARAVRELFYTRP
jgi:hypothetical protein